MADLERRADLTGASKAVSEALDEVNERMHGLLSSGSYHREFLGWLAERGYTVVPLSECCGVPLSVVYETGQPPTDLGGCAREDGHGGDCEPVGGWPHG